MNAASHRVAAPAVAGVRPVPAEAVAREVERVRAYLHRVGYSQQPKRSPGLYTAVAHLFARADEPRLWTWPMNR